MLLSPLMRGGNRHVALIPLEWIALLVLAALWAAWLLEARAPDDPEAPAPSRWLALLLLAPVLLAAVQLTPLPPALWSRLPGHEIYADTLAWAGVANDRWRPLSVSPGATAASLLAALPLVAVFLLACTGSRQRLRMLLRVVVAVAFCEVALALLQVSGGVHSPFFFGINTYGPPVGTFGNRNHFANYLAMALAAYTWLGFESAHGHKRKSGATRKPTAFSSGHATALWIAGGLVLVLGILLSRSRGAAAFGLPAAAAALAAASLRINGWSRGLRFALPVAAVLVAAAGAMIGFDNVLSRMSGSQLAASADFRGLLAKRSFDGAMAFWPWGAGWGTYDLAFQRFLPESIAGYPNHAHHDYVEMLFEGGLVFVLLAAAFAWLAAQRAMLLARTALRERTLDDEAMAATLCGLGLLGLLAHSLVEFNLRIPANAILGALLAGIYLRPLPRRPRTHDRPSQPHPPGD
ncbi:O-antigen ligase family protein [Caenimonas aquaedulcis]|uniref:O-antigen ligase family protein n=1 Tax=Caenimonas aquaedulcis TaxID=2793270 RepID=A0A931H5X2_9BURK|nr:O-antigen ligase family protein [Caenimonas aquaedulcis]MBG9389047.1 O-antigen ligase family protein [Caenimonas aquaedulcis]